MSEQEGNAWEMPVENKAGEKGAECARTMKKEPEQPAISYSVLGAASAVYALFYTFCLYKNASGITYPFFVAGTLAYLFFCMKKSGVPCCSRANTEEGESKGGRKKGAICFYAVSLVLLGISVCLTDDGKILCMTKTGIFLLTITLALQCFYMTQGWTFSKYLRAIGRSIVEVLHYIDTPFSDAAAFFGKRDKTKKSGNVRYVLLGFLIAVPLLLVILGLLLSADAVFSEMFAQLLGDLRLGTVCLVCLMTAAVYVISYSFVRGLSTYRMPGQAVKEKKGEPVAAITFTSLIAVIYLIFCTIQVVYLFMGKAQLPEGLTWANYARQGFFQLLFVCLINLVMVLVCLAFFKESRILKAVLAAISLMTYILIASSAYRMILYIRNYYLTFLRLFVLWSLAVIAVVFVGVILSIFRGSFPLFRYCVVVVTVFYIGLAFAKPDYWIAKYDLAHAEWKAGETKDAYSDRGYEDEWYLSQLSADAAPILAREDARGLWGDTMAFDYYYSRIWEKSENMTLRSFNFSRWEAKRSMEGWYDSGRK